MTAIKESRDVTAPQAQTPMTSNSIPPEDELCKTSPVKWLRETKGITAFEIIQVVQELYQYFDFAEADIVQKPDMYGLDLRQDAVNLLYARFAPELALKQPVKENRRLPQRIYGRLSEADYAELMGVIKRLGYKTVQDWLAVTVRRTLAASRWKNGGGEK